MSDRLADLRRQRALVQEQLNWLDAEINAAQPPSPAAPVVTPAPPTSPPAPKPATPARGVTPAALVSTPPAAAGTIDAMAAAMLKEYKIPPKSLHTDIRKGCLLYLIGAFAVLILGVTVLYFALRRN
jgi:hypothetical protein